MIPPRCSVFQTVLLFLHVQQHPTKALLRAQNSASADASGQAQCATGCTSNVSRGLMSKEDDEDAVPEHVPTASSRSYDAIDQRLKLIENRLVEHGVRLINGTHVMAEMKSAIDKNRDDVHAAELRLAPKPVDTWKYFAFAVPTIFALITAFWALSDKFASRPTTEQVRELIRFYSPAKS